MTEFVPAKAEERSEFVGGCKGEEGFMWDRETMLAAELVHLRWALVDKREEAARLGEELNGVYAAIDDLRQ